MRNRIKETIKNISYENGARVATVEQVISRADDSAKIGELYFRMSDLYRRSDEEITDEEREVIEKELAEVKAQIAVYTEYLNGYGA
jgi:hypothetical protein